MPTISVFFGIVVQMYYNDHPPPHVHAYYQGFEVLVAIESGDVIAGAMPAKASRLVCEWVLARQELLRENWALSRQKRPLRQIPGADMS